MIRRAWRRAPALAGCLVGLAGANPLDVPRDVQRAVRAATVEILPARCAGVVVGRADLVATARHCAERVGVRVTITRAGEEVGGTVVGIDEVADQAIVRSQRPLAVAPLTVAASLPIAGTVLFFAGNLRQAKWQSLRVDRLGECPSLPGLGNALFTSLRGAPGDSGAPLVDGVGRVVGLVHGGARCQIATPGDHLRGLVERVQSAPSR